MYWGGSKNIKDLLFRVLDQKRESLRGKRVVDMPAGNGLTSEKLFHMGADVVALDLFPEFFKFKEVQCKSVDLSVALPENDESVDWIIFQEGIEHLPDQLHSLKECARILRPRGRMILTTPNASNLRSKLAHLLLEAESLRLLPPNSLDSVWASDSGERVYFGHLFSIGIQRLRTLAQVAGLEVVRVHPARVNWTSLSLYLILAPWIWWKSSRVLRRSLRKAKLNRIPAAYQQALDDLRDLNILCSGHLIVEFEKRPPQAVESEHKRQLSQDALRDFIT